MSRHTLWLVLALWLLLVLTQSLDVSYLAYNRDAITKGDYWRLITGHFIHLNNMHLLLNMLGVGMVLMLFDHLLAIWQWIVVLLASALIISLLIYLNLPQVQAYVGLSGVIHTLYVLGTLQLLNQPKERNFAIILMLMVTLKLLTENVGQGISFTADMIGGRVLYQAHLYGALAGLFLGAIVVVLKHLHRQKK
jgi:rhomboid family GlyGly-CTERM serine protease